MKKQNADDRRWSFDSTLLAEKYRIIAGRTAVIAAVLIFIVAYIYGIATYGVFLGIALGWLPSGVAAWLTALAVNSVAGHVVRYGVMTCHQLSLLVRLLKPGAQHK